MNACFLDTSAVVDFFRQRLAVRVALESYDTLLLPFVVLGELIAGAYGARSPDAELERLEAWLLNVRVIGADEETASIYGKLLGDLERQGRRIPTNDVWAAAVAVQPDFLLLAGDVHFGRVPQLRWVNYRSL